MSDHSWVHIQIVLNMALRLSRLLFARDVTPSIVADHGLERARRRGRDRGRGAAALRRDVDPPHRPRVLLAVHGARQARRPARADLRRAGALDRRRRDDARDHLAPLQGRRRSRSRARSCASPTRSTWPAGARACRSRPATRTSTRCRRTRSRRSASAPATTRPSASRSRCRTPPGSSRSTRGWARSCAGRRSSAHIEVVARIEAEHEQRLVPVFRL